MIRRLILPVSLALNLVLLAVLIVPLHFTAAQTDSRYFPETQHWVRGLFWQYWQSHGGLAQQGYPLTEEFQEQNKLDGKTYTVQYFERAIFERHPENAGTPYEVLLSQLGKFELTARYPNNSNPAAAPVPGPSAPPTPVATPPTGGAGVNLLQSVSYLDGLSGRHLDGVLKNNTGQALGGVQIAASLLDGGGHTLATAGSIDYLSAYIPPGALLPFQMLVSNAPASWAGIQWQIVPRIYVPTDLVDRGLDPALSVADAQLRPPQNAFEGWSAVGQVHNGAEQTATLVAVHAAAYDTSGALLDVSAGFTQLGEVPAGGTSPFAVRYLRDRIQPARQDLFVAGRYK